MTFPTKPDATPEDGLARDAFTKMVAEGYHPATLVGGLVAWLKTCSSEDERGLGAAIETAVARYTNRMDNRAVQ